MRLKLVAGVAFVALMSVLAGAWPLALAALGVFAWMGRGYWRGVSPEARGGVGKVAEFLVAAPINFAAMAASRRWGRYAMLAALALMLLDASFGVDGIGFPVVGWTALYVAALVVGGYDWYRRKAPYAEAVEDAVYAAVAGHRVTEPPKITFGEGPLSKWFGRFQQPGVFSFYVPPQQRMGDVVEVEQHLREVLPAAVGTSWAFEWSPRTRRATARAVPDLPDNIWHPYTDGSFGNPAAPKGNPYKIPTGEAMGGEMVVWDIRKNPHMFAVGTTGGGKSVLLQGVLEHCFLWRDYFDVYLIDLKRTEFSEYADYPGLIKGLGTDHETSLRILSAAREEMDRRQDMLVAGRVPDIRALNDVRVARGEPRLKEIIVMLDEVGELLSPVTGSSERSKERREYRDECEMEMESIARLGRAMGVHLCYATQRNEKDIVSMQIRMNTQFRVAVGRLDPYASQIALENDLATTLPGKPGRGIVYEFGNCREFQVYRIEPENVREMIGVDPSGGGGDGRA